MISTFGYRIRSLILFWDYGVDLIFFYGINVYKSISLMLARKTIVLPLAHFGDFPFVYKF